MATIKGKLRTKSGDIMYPQTSIDKVDNLTVSLQAIYDQLAGMVDTSTDQTINGTKTFTTRPILYIESSLPEGYTELEYVETDGTQWIDTGKVGHANWHYEIDFQQTQAASYRLWGVFNQSSYIGYNMSLTYDGNWIFRFNFNSSGQENVTLAAIDTQRHIFKLLNGYAYLDNINKGITSSYNPSYVFDYNTFLGTINPAGTTTTTNAHAYFYSYKVWDENNELVQNLVPAKNSSGVIGMYDTVEDVFYTSATSTELIAGPIVSSNSPMATQAEIPTVPVNVSAFTNDIGYLTQATLSVGSLNTYNITSLEPSTSEKFTNDISLHKISKTGSYNDLLDKPTIPTAAGTLDTTKTTSLATSSTEALTGHVELHKISKTGDYNDLLNQPDIPTKTSELENDSEFITNETAQIEESQVTELPEDLQTIREQIAGLKNTYVASTTLNPALASQDDPVYITSLIDINNNQISIEDLNIGDSIYITQKEYPDRWVANFGNLPEEYRQVGYIINSGSSYIETNLKDIIGTQNFTISTEVALENDSRFGAIVSNKGAAGNTVGFAFYLTTGGTANRVYHSVGDGEKGYESPITLPNVHNGEFHTLSMVRDDSLEYPGYVLYDGVKYNASYKDILFSVDTGTNIRFFGNQSGASMGAVCKCKYIDIFVESTQYSHAVPCVRTSDNVVGMYDTIQKVFYSSATSTPFTYDGDPEKITATLYQLETAKVPVTGFKVDDISRVVNTIAEIHTVNSNYDPSLNPLATSSDIQVYTEGTGIDITNNVITTDNVPTEDLASDMTFTPTNTVGGCVKGVTYENKSVKELLEQILCPYVAFVFSSISGTSSFGTYEYGTSVTVSKVKPSFTAGSRTINSVKIGTTSGGDDLYTGTTATSGTNITLTTTKTFDGSTGGSIYCTLSDGQTTTTKSGAVSYAYYPYYMLSDNESLTSIAKNVATKSTSAACTSSGVSVTADHNTYIWFILPASYTQTKIQYEALGQWCDWTAGTSAANAVSIVLNSGLSVSGYKAYRLNTKMAAGTTMFRIVS